jgi:hypothetical protein
MKFSNKNKLFLRMPMLSSIITLGAIATAEATISDQEQLFIKCYEGIARNTPLRSSVPYQRVLNGTSAIQVCKDIIDDIHIGDDGYFTSKNPSRTPQDIVINVAMGLHRTHNEFVPSVIDTVTEQTLYLQGSLSWQTGADYWTYVMMRDLPFSSLINSKKAYFPLYERRPEGESEWRKYMHQPSDGKKYGLPTYATANNPTNSKTNYRPNFAGEVRCGGEGAIHGPEVRYYGAGGGDDTHLRMDIYRLRNHGVFKGIFEETYQKTYPNCHTGKTADRTTIVRNFVAKPHQSFGAGLIGMSGYLQAHADFRNYNREEAWSDGGMKVNRRWAQKVMEQFFCRKGAVLRVGDVAPFMNIPSTLQGGSHVPTFRIAATCMQCHATIDSMAYTIRGVVSGERNGDGYGGNQVWVIPEEYSGPQLTSSFTGGSNVQAFANALPASDGDFFRRPPEGALYYRTFRGNLVYVGPDRIKSLNDLGTVIAEQEDFYACAASRYLKELTSYEIKLDDPGTQGAELAKNEVYNWFANTLVKNFYQHKSVKLLMKEIMESKYFNQL